MVVDGLDPFAQELAHLALEDLDREIERFRMFGRAGLTEVALRLHDQPMEALEIIGEHVLPKLR